MSTKPGVTSRPVASKVSVASPAHSPISTMRSPAMPTSARRAGAAGAVDDRAAADHEVVGHGCLLGARDHGEGSSATSWTHRPATAANASSSRACRAPNGV